VRAYVDSSVVLRVALRSSDSLPEWHSIDQYVSSVLLRLECARTLERLRIAEGMSADEILERRLAVDSITTVAKLIAIDDDVLERAERAFSEPLKTLDAIHLATAIIWRDQNLSDLAFATHDDKLARAAQAAGFEVLGA